MKTQNAFYVGLLAMTVSISGCETTQEVPTPPPTPSPSGAAVAPAPRMTADRAHLIGREIAEVVVGKSQLLDSDKVSLYVNRVGQYTAFHLDTGPKNMKCVGGGDKIMPLNGFRFAVLHAPEKESIALPGGWIFITDSLLSELKSEDQLAGVLAHEATNVVCQHGMARMQKVADSVPKAGQAAAYDKILKSTLPMPYKKVADRGAMMALYRAGYSPEEYVSLVEKMSGPESADRIARMKKDLAKMQQKGLVDTKKARAARFAEFKKMAGV